MLGFSMFTGCPTDAPTDAAPPTVGNAAGMGGGQMGGAPPPGGGGSDAPMGQPPSLNVTAGEGVKLSGTLEYSGSVSGTVRMDLLSKDGQIVHIMTLEKLGAWDVEVPKDYGAMKISAFIDTDGNGPSAYEPTGEDTVTVGAEAVSGVTITLKDGTGSAPPGGTSTSTSGSAPPADGDMGSAAGGGTPPPPSASGEAPPAVSGGAPAAGGAPTAGGDAKPEGKAGGKAEGKAEGKAPK